MALPDSETPEALTDSTENALAGGRSLGLSRY